MQFLRKVFFYIFAAIYVFFCPLLILYAFGYIYRPGAKEGIVKTGLISLSTAPAGATVYMNNSRYTQKTPAIIRELLPGDYSIKLTLSNYQPWAQTVPVEVEKATVLDKILLLPLQWKQKKLLSGEFQDLIPVPRSGFFLLSRGKTAGDIFVYDYRGRKSWPLLKAGSPFTGFERLSQFAVQKSPALLLHLGSREGEKILWIVFTEEGNIVKDVTDLFPVKPLRVEWLPQQRAHLFSFQEGCLNRVDVDSGAIYPGYIQNVRGYGLFGGEIYVLKDDSTFLKMSYGRKNQEMLIADPALGASIFGKRGFFSIHVLSEDLIIFRGEEGELLANRLPYHFIEKGVRGIEYYAPSEYVLVWQKDRIGILDFSSEETGNVEFEKGPGLSWIYRKGKDIRQCFWVYDGSHILFRDGNDIFLLEIETYGKYALNHIFKVKEKSSVYYSEQTGEMYFLDPSTGDLLSVIIVPGKGIFPSSFPGTGKEKKKTGVRRL